MLCVFDGVRGPASIPAEWLSVRDARYTAVTGIPRYLGVPVRTAVRFLNTGIPRHQMIEV